jgi:trehalose 6-phosphate phosphatase
MRYILSARNHAILKKFAAGNLLVAFDFDGTLAPIVSKPGKAAARPATRKLLRHLTSLYPCIIVSGRSRRDVRRKLGGIRFKEFIGNHGIEPWNSSRTVLRLVKTWIPVLKQGLAKFHGVVMENKRFSLSIHYRRVRDKKKALQTIREAARALPGARLVGGKQVINIVPDQAPDKGIAVERARQEMKCDRVIYVGDDRTDEDVFARARRGRYLTIRVGAARSSSAGYYIRNQREVDLLLKTLIDLRSDFVSGTRR